MIRNNPDKSEFSNFLHCVLCTRLLILKAHVPSKKVNLRSCERAGVRFIVKCNYEPKEVVLLLSSIGYFIRDGPTDLVWSSIRVPLERVTSTLKRRNATRRADKDKLHCRCLQTFSGKRKLVRTLLRIRFTKNWTKGPEFISVYNERCRKKYDFRPTSRNTCRLCRKIPSIRDKLPCRAILRY